MNVRVLGVCVCVFAGPVLKVLQPDNEKTITDATGKTLLHCLKGQERVTRLQLFKAHVQFMLKCFGDFLGKQISFQITLQLLPYFKYFWFINMVFILHHKMEWMGM